MPSGLVKEILSDGHADTPRVEHVRLCTLMLKSLE